MSLFKKVNQYIILPVLRHILPEKRTSAQKYFDNKYHPSPPQSNYEKDFLDVQDHNFISYLAEMQNDINNLDTIRAEYSEEENPFYAPQNSKFRMLVSILRDKYQEHNRNFNIQKRHPALQEHYEILSKTLRDRLYDTGQKRLTELEIPDTIPDDLESKISK